MAQDDAARIVARARERFLESGDAVGIPVRAGIVESWRRSRSFAVEADRLNPPYLGQVDQDSCLCHAAKPILDRLEQVVGSGMCAVLTDARARVLNRRAAEASLARHLDRIRLAPGFSFAEEHIGTNGIGTTLQAHQPHIVLGAEHFIEGLHTTACAAVPIRDSRRRLVGLLDVTCRYQDSTPQMPSLVYHAASAIEQRLLELGSERDHAVLEEFRAACRHGSRPVVTMSDNLTMTNVQAADLLTPADHAIIHEAIASRRSSGSTEIAHAILSRGDRVLLHCRSIVTAAGTAGAVIEIHPAEGS